jgi:hypothetical protein
VQICQFAEQNPDVLFLQVNYEEHKSMCHSLHVHVLPLFRFYRGAQGRLCSFSCTNATVRSGSDQLLNNMQQTQNDLYSLLVTLLELNLVNKVVNPGRACWQPNFSFGPKWLILLLYLLNMRSKE